MVKKNEYESGTYWDQLSTEQLEDILRADIASPNQTNDETVFHILEVLEKREKENRKRKNEYILDFDGTD